MNIRTLLAVLLFAHTALHAAAGHLSIKVDAKGAKTAPTLKLRWKVTQKDGQVSGFDTGQTIAKTGPVTLPEKSNEPGAITKLKILNKDETIASNWVDVTGHKTATVKLRNNKYTLTTGQ